jgi:hypothetical protein
MCCVATITLALVAGIHRAVGVDSAAVAVVLEAVRAIGAVLLETAACLGADTDARALLDVLDVLSDLYGLANDLVANDAGCVELDMDMWGKWGRYVR